MASLTENFKLTKLDPGDSLATNGYGFISSNMDVVDRVLGIGPNHEHTAAAAVITSPTLGPALVLDTTSGVLPAGTTVRYRYTYVDQYGAETAASPETILTTPAAIVVPVGPSITVAATGGFLLGGLYNYALTAYTSTDAQETTVGGRTSLSIPYTTATNIASIILPTLPSGATGFNLYRRGPGEAIFSFLASIDMNVATPPLSYADNGTVVLNYARQPPNANLTSSSNNITITLPGATPTVPANVTWKIYRSYVNGNWHTSNLHHVIEETFVGSGVIVATYVDTGLGTGLAIAPEVTEILPQPGKITLTDNYEVDGVLPAGMNLVYDEVSFSMPGALSVSAGSTVWRCPFDNIKIVECAATLGIGSTPNSTDVIIDINKYDTALASWSSIYTTQANRPKVTVGAQIGVATAPDIIALIKGDLLSVDIDQIGGGTNTDRDLAISILYIKQSGSTTTTVTVP